MSDRNNEILAKSTGESLFEHTQKVFEGIKKLRNMLKERFKMDKDFWNLLEKAAIVHDFGKIYSGFQNIINSKIKNNDDNELAYIHSLISPIFVQWYSLKNENWQKIFLSAIVFHHWRGRINNIVFGNQNPEILLKIKKEFDDDLKKLQSIFKKFDIQNFFVEKFSDDFKSFRFFDLLIPPANMQFLPEMLKKISEFNKKGFTDEWIKKYIFFKGFLLRADHFASSEIKDINNIEREPLKFLFIKQNIQNKIGKNIKLWQIDKLKDKREELKDKNVILIGATGIGKTEFAFLWGADDKIIFTLPMRTMVDQAFSRAIDLFGKENVGLLHGTMEVSLLDYFNEQSKRDNIYQNEFDITIEKILSKELSYPVIISTGDQIFPVVLKYPGYEKMMSILGYSRLIIDEVQAYDSVASAIIVKSIEEIVKLGGKFLLMTATLPKYIKDEIKNRIGENEFVEKKVFSKEGDEKGDTIKKHKIYIKANTDYEKYKQKTDKKKKNNDNNRLEENWESFKIFAKEIIKQNNDKNFLIIVNTVKNAQEVYKELKKEYTDIILLHSRFINDDRKEKIKQITNKEKKPKILITTQIVEASVDIDYDILITELAPLDSLVQRMGRVNRNRGNYQEDIGEVYIWNRYIKGSEYVYKKELLEHTYNVLKEYNDKIISEKEKQKILTKYYDTDNEAIQSIKTEFEKNLETLDNLYTANSLAEAHKMFRDIHSVNILILPDNNIKKFIEQLLQKETKTEILAEILKYTISKPFNWQESEQQFYFPEEIKNKRQIQGIKNILKNYYLSNNKYDKDKGLFSSSFDKESSSPIGKHMGEEI